MDPILRTAAASALLLGVSVGSVLGVRGRAKPYSPEAPAYRQKGPADAKIVIVEYSDFQCPACRAALPGLKQLLELYGKDIRVVFKHFPLERPHPHARPAAAASECAGRQGKFWEFHDGLFDSQAGWGGHDQRADPKPSFRALAKSLKLDPASFEACLADPAPDKAVAEDMTEGDRRWVQSTPTFFVNGRRFVGGLQLAKRGSLWIEKEIKKR